MLVKSHSILEQDKGLDSLHAVIQRQKRMGQAIGDEIDYHNGISIIVVVLEF